MRLGSLFVLLFINIVWLPLEANGNPGEVQNPCKDDGCGSHSSVHVNGLTVNIFPGLRNSVSDLPPALRQLLGGLTDTKNCNSTHEKNLDEDVEEEVETTFHPGEVTDAPGPRDDRPVPDNVDIGSDGFSYFLGTEKFGTVQECRGYCHRFRGFRLAIAKTTETLNQLRKYEPGIIDLAIFRWGDNVKLLWGDGTPLNYSTLLASSVEPLINQPDRSNTFVMWPSGPNRILDDLPYELKEPCLCQGSSEKNFC